MILIVAVVVGIVLANGYVASGLLLAGLAVLNYLLFGKED